MDSSMGLVIWIRIGPPNSYTCEEGANPNIFNLEFFGNKSKLEKEWNTGKQY
jgi:hypothetical protein